MISVDGQHRCFNTNNKLLIDQCAFDHNEAFQGASAYFSQDSCRCQPLVETTVCSSNFTNGHCGNTLKSEFALPCSGYMLLQMFSLFIKGTTTFTANQQSAMKFHSSSSIKLLPSAELQFINNTALRGAALHLVDCSSVIVTSSTALLSLNNIATDQGGAIYAENCNVVQTGGRQCFIRHTNSSLHPNDWETTFNFGEN